MSRSAKLEVSMQGCDRSRREGTGQSGGIQRNSRNTGRELPIISFLRRGRYKLNVERSTPHEHQSHVDELGRARRHAPAAPVGT